MQILEWLLNKQYRQTGLLKGTFLLQFYSGEDINDSHSVCLKVKFYPMFLLHKNV